MRFTLTEFYGTGAKKLHSWPNITAIEALELAMICVREATRENITYLHLTDDEDGATVFEWTAETGITTPRRQ